MTRLQAAPNLETETLTLKVADGTSMTAYASRPSGVGPFPGLLVFQEAFGLNHYIRGMADRLAREGYFALAPELFHRSAPGFEGSYTDFGAVMPHVRALTNEGLRADAKAAFDFLAGDSRVASGQVGAIGFCMGGRTSFLAAATCPLRAAVSFYGSGIAPVKTTLISNPGLLDRAPLISGPLLLFWGGRDKNITRDHHRQVADALAQAGKNSPALSSLTRTTDFSATSAPAITRRLPGWPGLWSSIFSDRIFRTHNNKEHFMGMEYFAAFIGLICAIAAIMVAVIGIELCGGGAEDHA